MKKSKFERGQFIAWDGEGEEVNGVQQYVMLCNSLGETLVNEEGITTEQALNFICGVARNHPNAIHVMFGASYDVNMMLRSMGELSRDLVTDVWNKRNSDEYTEYKDWQIKYVPRKEFSIRRYSKGVDGKKIWNDKRKRYKLDVHVTIWDVWGFFQSTFIEALGKWLPDYRELERIKRGKARRGAFSCNERQYTIQYCIEECKALVLMMEQLRGDLITAGLVISRWDGAGAVAAALLKREQVKEHMAKCPQEVYEAAKGAYAGGRIESPKYGMYNDRIYHYDINSAYPEAIGKLPSLTHGTWVHDGSGIIPDDYDTPFSVCYVRWQLNDATIYPFFHRDVNNRISYPREGEGWHWLPEVKSATLALLNGWIKGGIEIVESWRYYDDSNTKPFDFVPAMYDLRRRWKQSGISAEKVLKLGLNSLYGKMAQQCGYRDGKPPTYFQLEWAGYVTAYTRAKLYTAAIGMSESIVMLCTDGIFSTARIPWLECGEELGQWEYKEHAWMLAIQSGVYFYGNGDGKVKQFSRGFDKDSLDHREILDSLARNRTEHSATQTRFVTMGAATRSDELWPKWCTWLTRPRVLKLTPEGTKRDDMLENEPKLASYRLLSTLPRWNLAPDYPSSPYPVRWDGKRDEEYAQQVEELQEAGIL